MPALSLLVLRCADLAASLRFYERLGLVLTAERHGDGPEHFSAPLGNGVLLELYPGRAEMGPADAVTIGVAVDDPEVVLARCIVDGVPLTRDATSIDTLVMRDPDGRRVRVEACGDWTSHDHNGADGRSARDAGSPQYRTQARAAASTTVGSATVDGTTA